MKHKFMSKGNRYEPQKPKVQGPGVSTSPPKPQEPAIRADSGQDRAAISPITEQSEPQKITLFDVMSVAIEEFIQGAKVSDIEELFVEFLNENKENLKKHPSAVRSAGTMLSGQISHASTKVHEFYQRAIDRVLREAPKA